jgi:hypothetical protein
MNKNYAALWPWIDRFFGTLYLPKDKQPAHYGIDEPMPTGFMDQLVQPYLILEGSAASQAAAADPTSVRNLSPNRALTS